MKKYKKGLQEGKTIEVHVYYDSELSEIAGKKEEVIAVERGITSGDFVNLLVTRYPQFLSKFDFDDFAYERNDHSAKKDEQLEHNDTFVFSTWTVGEMRDEIRSLLQIIVEYYNIPFTVEDALLKIFEEERGELDRRAFVKNFIQYIDEPERIPATYALLNQAWFFFPHHYLNGKAPIELAKKIVHTKESTEK